MSEQFIRTEMLIGEAALKNLSQKRVAVFGIGGVGGYVCEALVRAGIGEFDLCDDDEVAESNLNRQIIATHSTIGMPKVEVMRQRMLDINPNVKVNVYQCFFLPENSDNFPFDKYDYVVDAVDTVTAKLEIIMKAKEFGVPVISSMGTGNKLNPAAFKVADIYKTNVDPLARVMRRELKKRGVKDLKVVYSEEMPLEPSFGQSTSGEKEDSSIFAPGGNEKDKSEINKEQTAIHQRRSTPGSMSFVPPVAGLILASEVVKDLMIS